jgi:CheY-like chemotaxis protein
VNVLVIDDDADIRDVLAEVLEENGYTVSTASNGREALERLRAGASPPSFILLDVMMPIMDGWQFRAEQVRDPTLASIPVVVITAVGDARLVAEQMKAAGALRKPVRLKDLLASVAQFAAAPTR